MDYDLIINNCRNANLNEALEKYRNTPAISMILGTNHILSSDTKATVDLYIRADKMIKNILITAETNDWISYNNANSLINTTALKTTQHLNSKNITLYKIHNHIYRNQQPVEI